MRGTISATAVDAGSTTQGRTSVHKKADDYRLEFFLCFWWDHGQVTTTHSVLFSQLEYYWKYPIFSMFRDTSVSLFLMSSGSDGIGHVEVHSKMKPLFTAIVVCKTNCVRDHAWWFGRSLVVCVVWDRSRDPARCWEEGDGRWNGFGRSPLAHKVNVAVFNITQRDPPINLNHTSENVTARIITSKVVVSNGQNNLD